MDLMNGQFLVLTVLTCPSSRSAFGVLIMQSIVELFNLQYAADGHLFWR